MSMESSRRSVYFWILMTTLAHWVVECDKLEGYSFPVYNTTSCPRNQSEWRNRSSALNCTDSNGYMCIPNENITQLLEFCYRYPRIPIEKNICLILKKSTSLVDAYSCKQFRNGCPDKQYWSNEFFEYPSCLSIGNRCFLAEPLCKDEGVTTVGSEESRNTKDATNGNFGPTTVNDTAITENAEKNSTWVWILLIGGILIFGISVMVILCNRRRKRTLSEGIIFIELKDKRNEIDERQPSEDEAFFSQQGTKIGNAEGACGGLDPLEEYEEELSRENTRRHVKNLDSPRKDRKKRSVIEKLFPITWNRFSNPLQMDNSKISLKELEKAGIGIDSYKVWKTDMSEKYKQLTKEEQSILYCLLCSDESAFLLEKTDALKERFSNLFKTVNFSNDVCKSIQEMKTKGFVSIVDKRVTFASDDVQDETMYNYIQTNWNKIKEDVLVKVSLESAVKYFRSQGFRKGKYIRCFSKSFQNLKEFHKPLLTRMITKFGKDLLLHEIMDDRGLHYIISATLKIPEEVLLWDIDARKRYLEYLKKGKAPIYRARAMIVGCAGAGKTTLLKRLQKKSMEEIKQIKSTVGLDVHIDIFEVQEKEGKLQVAWHKCEPSINIKENNPLESLEKKEENKLLGILDFGGQCMYYACHQIYLSKRAFYILVVDMSKNLENVIDEDLCDQRDTMFSEWSNKDYLLFWLKSVDCYSGRDAPVILVATHTEGKSEQEKIKYYEDIIESLPVSSTIKEHLSIERYFTISLPKGGELSLENVDELEKCIVEVAKSQKQWGEEMPEDWAKFKEFILEEKKEKIRCLSTLKQLFDKVLPLSEREFADLLRFYHDIGLILYFSFKGPEENAFYLDSDIVMLDIQWFVDSFKYVITDLKQKRNIKVLDAAPTGEDFKKLKTTGEISEKFLKKIWESTNNPTAVEYIDDMLKYMERLGLVVIEKKSSKIFIPSMNRMKLPEHVRTKINLHITKSPTLYFKFPVLPIFIFYRLTVLCLKRWKPLSDGRKCIYIDTTMFHFGEHVLVLGVSESYIQLLLYNDDRTKEKAIQTVFGEVKREVHEMLKSLEKTLNNRLNFKVGYSCKPEFLGIELKNTFVKESTMLGYKGKTCPLHAHAKDHSTESLKIFLKKERKAWEMEKWESEMEKWERKKKERRGAVSLYN